MNNKKLLKEKYLKQQQETKLNQMPISVERLVELLEFLERSLTPKGCDHSLHNATSFFKNDRKLDEILLWLRNNGGGCDCEIILNVTNEYEFILKDYLNKSLAPNSREKTKKSSVKITLPLDSAYGLKLETFPQTWKLYKSFDSGSNIEILTFCLGKKGLKSECIVSYVEKDWFLDFEDQESVNNLWQAVSGLTGGVVQIDFKTIDVDQHQFNAIALSNKNWLPVYIWIYDPKALHWYFLVKTNSSRRHSDWESVMSLFSCMRYQPV